MRTYVGCYNFETGSKLSNSRKADTDSNNFYHLVPASVVVQWTRVLKFFVFAGNGTQEHCEHWALIGSYPFRL